MAYKKIILRLSECIKKEDQSRIEKDLPPLNSIRGLARELEQQWPERYDSNYLINRLHRANKNGIKNPTSTLINDILSVLDVSEQELVKFNTLPEKISSLPSPETTIKLHINLKGNDAINFISAVNKLSNPDEVIGLKEILSSSESDLFKDLSESLHSQSPQNKKGTVRVL